MTEYEYAAIVYGQTLRNAEVEAHYRRLAFFLINVNVAKKHQLRRYSDVWPIPVLDGVKEEETEEDRQKNYQDFTNTVEFFKRKK